MQLVTESSLQLHSMNRKIANPIAKKETNAKRKTNGKKTSDDGDTKLSAVKMVDADGKFTQFEQEFT